MKAVITGATGFVGKWLVNELLNQQDEVTIIVRNEKQLPTEWKNKVKVVLASLEQFSELDVSYFDSNEMDIFFHLAWAGTSGMQRADTDLQLSNVKAACESVHLATRLHCKRFVNAGSIMEYEAIKYISEDGSKPGGGNIYSTAKMTADFMAKIVATQEGIHYINVIISNIYGIGENSPRFLNSTLKKMILDEKIPLTHGNQLYDFIYISDAVKAIIHAGKKGRENASYYIGNESQKPLKEFINEMKKILGSNSELAFGEIPFCGAMLSYREFDTRALANLGFLPEISFGKGILLTRDWMVKNTNELKF